MSEEVKSTATVDKKEKGVGFGTLMAWSLRPASTGIATMIMGYRHETFAERTKLPGEET